MSDDLYKMLRDTARGDAARVAAVDLLFLHGRWPQPLYDHGYIHTTTPEDEGYEGPPPEGWEPAVYIRWKRVVGVLDCTVTDIPSRDRDALLVGSGSERRMLALACSLAGAHRINVGDIFTSLDTNNRRLALACISAAAGLTGPLAEYVNQP